MYISWAGEKSRRAALAIGEWLPWVIPCAEPYVPPQSIDAIPWNREREEAAIDSRFGILCVTQKNLYDPWLVFEAGALVMTAAQPCVSAFLLDVRPTEVSGPLSLFQTAVCEEGSVRDLIQSLNRACGEAAVPKERLESSFSYWFPDLRENLDDLRDLQERPRRKDEQMPHAPSPVEDLLALSRENQKLLRVSDARVDVGMNDLRRGMDDLRHKMDDLLSRLGRDTEAERRAIFPRSDKLTQDQIDRLIRMYRWQPKQT